MGYESIAYEAESRMGYWLIGYEGERNNCFSQLQLVGQKNIETKRLSQVKARHQLNQSECNIADRPLVRFY